MLDTPRVSIAIPVYNEEGAVGELFDRLGKVLDSLDGGPHEIVVVDDGSSDRTVELLTEIAKRERRLVILELSRNFGHQAALSAALEASSGDVVILMDGDLQDAPEVIPRFLAKYAEGFDVVAARRVRRKENWLKRLAYYGFYRVIRSLSKPDLPLDSGDFGLVSRRAADQIIRLPESHRYLRGLRTWVGFRQTSIEVERESRVTGKSKYSLSRMFQLASDGIFSFSIVPLRLATLIGFLAIAGSAVFALYAVYERLFLDRSPQGFTALLIAIVFLFGVQFVMFGILGEYIGRIFEQSKARPHYIVMRKTGPDDHEE